MPDYNQAVANVVKGLAEQNFNQYANTHGVPVAYNPDLQRLTVNNVPVDISKSGLQVQDGKLMGTEDVYKNLLAPFASQGQGTMDQTPYQTPEYIKQFIKDTMAQQTAQFEYNIDESPEAQLAKQQLQDSIAEMTGKRGFLYGSAQQSLVDTEFNKLAPMFEEAAYQRNQDYLNRQMAMVNTVMQWDQIQASNTRDNNQLLRMKSDYIMKLDQRDLELFKTMLNQRRFELELSLDEQKFEMEKKSAEYEIAWKKMDELGYADNETAILLGINPGTEAGWIRKMLAEAQSQMSLMNQKHKNDMEKLNLNKNIEMELIAERSRIQTESQARLMETEYSFDLAMADVRETHRRENEAIAEREREIAEAAAKREAEQRSRVSAQNAAKKTNMTIDYNQGKGMLKGQFSKYIKYGVIQEGQKRAATNYLYELYKNGMISNPTYNRLMAEYRLPDYTGGSTVSDSRAFLKQSTYSPMGGAKTFQPLTMDDRAKLISRGGY